MALLTYFPYLKLQFYPQLAISKTSRGLGTSIFSLRYKHSISIELKNGARHLKDHPKISKFTKFDGYWFTPKGMVHLVWTGGTGVLQSILSPLILKVYHAFVFKPITIKFGKFTNFWMLFPMTCLVFNQIDTEGWYQEKICSYPLAFEMANFSNFSISQTKFPQGTEKRGEFCKFNIIGAISYTRHISSSPRFYCISKGN